MITANILFLVTNLLRLCIQARVFWGPGILGRGNAVRHAFCLVGMRISALKRNYHSILT